MKPLSYAFLAAIAACSFASAAETAYTTPVGYYDFDGQTGGNLFVPGLVKGAAYAGAITASTSTTLTVSGLTAGAFDAVGGNATHYVEITQAGANQGVVIDVASNTATTITLASDISALSLAGTEKIAVRPHVTLKSAFSSAEASIAAFTDSATFYETNGGITTYYFDGVSDWTSDFVNPDGTNRPIPPGTGLVLGLSAAADLTVAGEVKEGPTVVQLTGGVVNIAGPVNPLVGQSLPISDLGFENLLAFTDSLTLYSPGSLNIIGTYYADGAGDVTLDFVNPSTDPFAFTTGGVVTASSNTSLKLESGVTVTP